MVTDDFEWAQVFRNPADNFCPVCSHKLIVRYSCNIQQGNITDFVSAFVCWWWEKVTFPLPFLSKDAVIVPDPLSSFTTVLRACFAVPASIATFNASSPQQLLTCFCILLVEVESFLSRNHWTVFLQLQPIHLKTWLQQPLTYSVAGVGLKNAYIGEVHFLPVALQ